MLPEGTKCARRTTAIQRVRPFKGGTFSVLRKREGTITQDKTHS